MKTFMFKRLFLIAFLAIFAKFGMAQTANAGTDQNVCANQATLNATPPTATNTGKWTVVPLTNSDGGTIGGGGTTATLPTISDDTSPTATVTNLMPGKNILVWTVTSSDANTDSDTVIITNLQIAKTAPDIDVCKEEVKLIANQLPPTATGNWSLTTGGGTIYRPTANITMATLTQGENKFTWTVTADGCTSTDVLTINNKAINVTFTHTITNKEITLTPTTATTVENYNWEFGDGYTASAVFSATNNDKTHTYTKDGVYEICLSSAAVDNTTTTNCADRFCKKITIGDPTIADFDQTDNGSNTIKFTNNSSTATNLEYYWDFGDGKFSDKIAPEHQFEKPGIYKVTLVVKKKKIAGGDIVANIVKEIKVGNIECLADFDYHIDPVNKEVKLSDMSEGATDWKWDLGNGSFENVPTPKPQKFENYGSRTVCLHIYDQKTNCQASKCKTITVKESNDTKPVFKPDFVAYVDTATRKVVIEDISTGDIKGRYWTFGDGTIQETTLNKINKTLPKKGIYNICLHIFNPIDNKQAKICKDIAVGTPDCFVKANFKQFVDVANNKVAFAADAIGGTNKYFWTFGDGQVSNEIAPVHTYKKPGLYKVTLSVKNPKGCADHITKKIQVDSLPCVADFEYRIDYMKREIKFINMSKGKIGKSFWQFGDGSIATTKDAIHKFPKLGIFKVSLVVESLDGTFKDIETKEIQLGRIPCKADFKYFVDPETNTIDFANTSVFSSLGIINTGKSFWTFGDGTTSTEMAPTHEYNKPGIYTVTLNIHNGGKLNSCVDKVERKVIIGKMDKDVESDFDYMITDGATNEIDVTNSSLAEDELEYTWNFGDGTTAKVEKPEKHQFSKPGLYNVCLIATSKTNSDYKKIKCKRVIVQDGTKKIVKAEFAYTVDDDSTKVAFADLSEGEPNEYQWDFGDGTTSTEANPIKEFDKEDFYIVKLTVKNTTDNTISKKVVVIKTGKQDTEKLKAGFVADTITATNAKAGGYPVDFIGAAFGDPAKVEWDYGDGETEETTTTPTHTYSDAGTYNVCYTVSDPITGQTDEYCDVVAVGGTTNVEQTNVMNTSLSTYPNPCSDVMNLKYSLNTQSDVNISIYDMCGHQIKTIVNKQQLAGTHTFEWNTKILSNGVYFVKMTTGQGTITNKIVIAK